MYRLALNLGNDQAANMLYQIPTVRVLAEANNDYITERQTRLDKIAVASLRDSFMSAVRQGPKEEAGEATTDRRDAAHCAF